MYTIFGWKSRWNTIIQALSPPYIVLSMEKMVVAGLILVPALSPYATKLPVFLAVGKSSSMLVLAIIVLFCSTITVMITLVALSFYGASQLKFHWVERYDKL